ncbi:hypothetical protein EDD80_10550 [Anseongella ginsenosidimutans]|uniref:Uncharacterized protein n=1 Tax=Anseongella ginsenosidimutans TaxID=496056 RepID=A0A4R3KRU8_9SPHI|nr:hypothetical protein [Anseongella ginsenosidimutans]QEC52850.1 hypothetical protein FRZ59_11245 [Anseongella ginsenosidimutans]TCS87237.1 hypothetical protein EDD80_10550 [Anseongella ginsenosidimutans]
MKTNRIFLTAALLLAAGSLTAQHMHHQADSAGHEADSAGHQEAEMHSPPMSHSFSESLPMNRNGSGTGWLPDAAPMYGYMLHTKKWMYMFHGNVFLRYNNQDIGNEGSRGGDKIDAPNWFMGMGQTRLGKRGLFRFSAMLSLDPLTVGGEGYPLLFQSGETWNGEPLVDRQHPHDLFSELSVAYTYKVSDDADAFAYLGYPGEPALGPVAFMHRVSSLPNPDAPIGHHWQDATHITFGVGTLGFRYKDFKLEGSVFTGREPDEERYGFDRPRFDSWSARLSYNPSPSWALQVSQARVKDVHELGPREDVNKTTASVIHALRLGSETFLNSAAVWGYNDAESHHKQHSLLLETALSLRSTTIYGKYEWVEKLTEDLVLDEEHYGHGTVFPVNAVHLGVQQRLLNAFKTNLALGVQGSWYGVDDQLQDLYGSNPLALQVYLRIYPGMMSQGAKR